MKRTTIVLSGVVVIGFGIAVALRHPDSGGGRAAEATDMSREVRALRAEVDALKARAQRPTVYHVEPLLERAAPTLTPAAAEPVEVVEESAEMQAARAAERNHETATELASRFAGEYVDRAWSAEAVRSLRSAFGPATPGTQLVEADCASTLCRVVLRHDDRDAQYALGDALAGKEQFGPGVFFDYDKASDPPKTTLFVLRPGASFRDETGTL
jgi:hypothetical protein